MKNARKHRPIFIDKSGSMLVLIMAIMGVLTIGGALALSKYNTNARANRTVASTVESNIFFSSVKQFLDNQTLCSQAISSSHLTFTDSLGEPVAGALPVSSLAATIGGHSLSVAFAGMNSNGIRVSNPSNQSSSTVGSLQAVPGGKFGIQYQSSNPSLNGSNCTQAALTLSTAQGSGMGSNTVLGSMSKTFPIVVLSDPSTGLATGCFGGSAFGVCQPMTPPAAATVTLSADKNCYDPFDTTPHLSWSSTNATNVDISCTGGQNIPSASPVASGMGTITVTPSTGSITCTATATGLGSPASVTIPIAVQTTACSASPPTVNTFSFTPSCTSPGTSVTLNWSTTGATSVSVLDSSGTQISTSTSGPLTVHASGTAGSYPYTITATNSAGSASSSAVLSVQATPVITSFTIPTSTGKVGSTFLMNWAVTNASTVTIAITSPPGPPGTTQPPSGSTLISPALGTTTYTLSVPGACSGPPVTASQNVTVTSGGIIITDTFPTANPISISSGANVICAVLSDGTMDCWQPAPTWATLNDIGVGPTPTVIPGITSATSSSAGLRTCAIVSGGEMCLGDNINASGLSRPYQTAGGWPGGSYRFAKFSTGTMQNGLAQDTHTDYAVARANQANPTSIADPTYKTTTPRWVFGKGPGSGVTQTTSNCMVVGGALECWGEEFVGQFGNMLFGAGGYTNYEGDTFAVYGPNEGVVYPPVANVASPTTVIPSGVTQVSSGSFLTCAVVNGGVQCAGLSEAGEAGLTPVYWTWQNVNAHNSTECPGVVPGSTLSHEDMKYGFATAGDGYVHCQPTFKQIIPPGSGVIQVAVSKAEDDTSAMQGLFACALFADGTVKCWGGNLYGQLGNGTVSNPVSEFWQEDNGYWFWQFFAITNIQSPANPTPSQVVGLGAGSGVTSIVAGNHAACAIKSDGSAWCWGNGPELGQYLNNGSTYTTASQYISTGSYYYDEKDGSTDQSSCGAGECSGNATCTTNDGNPYSSCTYNGNTAVSCTSRSSCDLMSEDGMSCAAYYEQYECGITVSTTYVNTIAPTPVPVNFVTGPITDIKPEVWSALINGHVYYWGPSASGGWGQHVSSPL